jgi:hypothetical protein
MSLWRDLYRKLECKLSEGEAMSGRSRLPHLDCPGRETNERLEIKGIGSFNAPRMRPVQPKSDPRPDLFLFLSIL